MKLRLSGVCVFLLFVICSVQANADKVVPETRSEITFSFAPIVKRVAPAVVNVYATRMVNQRSGSPFFDDPFFRQFFGNRSQGRTSKRVESSLGSGVIIDPSGIIITNHHVIKGADRVKIALSDKREFEADIILKDEKTDLAVLRVREPPKEGFASLEFFDSDKLEVGDLVLAIGNPFGVGQTVTSGIISALARSQVGIGDYQFFIQTDAAINPGNSGGALVDIKGRLVGVNTAIFSKSGGSNGIGFAIPSNMVRAVAASSTKGGLIRRPWVGAAVQEVTTDIAESLGLLKPVGVLITAVVPDSPAADAGLRTGDLVLSIDDIDIGTPNGFGYRLATKGTGGNALFSVLRNGRQHKLSVAMIIAPELPLRAERRLSSRSPFSGTTIVNLSPAVAEELRLDTQTKGVIITRILQRSPAARLGFKPGDIIQEINGRTIGLTDDLVRASKSGARRWQLVIRRGNRTIRTVLGR